MRGSFAAEVEKIVPDWRIFRLMEIVGGQTRVAVAANGLICSVG